LESEPLKELRVALVHDWLTGLRGGERVLDCLAQAFPQAHLFTLLKTADLTPAIDRLPLTCSPAQRLPFLKRYYRHYLPLYPWAVSRLDLTGFDLVISTSHCVAKGAVPGPGALHLSYVFTPMRYIWDLYPVYFGRRSLAVRALMGLIAPRLRAWDKRTCGRIGALSCISGHVADRIRRCWGREAEVIHPPLELDRFRIGPPGEFYLILSALAPYKGIELAVKAANRARFRLVVAGEGQEAERLRSLAGETVTFLGRVDEARAAELYRQCRAFIFPGEEDFGITPLEAMASGKAVIALGRGGILETVTPLNPGPEQGRTPSPPGDRPSGVFFHEPTPEALIRAVELFEANLESFDQEDLRAGAARFDRKVFLDRFLSFVARAWEAHSSGPDIS